MAQAVFPAGPVSACFCFSREPEFPSLVIPAQAEFSPLVIPAQAEFSPLVIPAQAEFPSLVIPAQAGIQKGNGMIFTLDTGSSLPRNAFIRGLDGRTLVP